MTEELNDRPALIPQPRSRNARLASCVNQFRPSAAPLILYQTITIKKSIKQIEQNLQ
jgi:hypothetical protein